MDYLKNLKVVDQKNKSWGEGTISVVNNEMKVYFPKKTGMKFQTYSYPLDFKKRLKLVDENEEIVLKIDDAIWFEEAVKESLAFKYNLCDGGCSETKLGFDGVCSDECIKNNIKNASRAWCSKSPCNDYYSGKKTREEIDKAYNDGAFFCYESRLMKDWKASVGVDDNGRPRRLGSNVINGLAVITSVDSSRDENNRFIFAVFLIRSQEYGDDFQEGSVSASDGKNKEYCITLSREEAKKMKFWNYYSNPNKPEKIIWGTGLYRFISFERSARILKDIVDIKTDEEEKKKAAELLEEFCNLHDIKEIPERDGALSVI